MIELYMDEEKEALKILELKDLGYRPSSSICILAKYYLQVQNKTKKETEDLIIDFIKNKTKINYKPSDWEKCIVKNIKKAEKIPIVKIDKIEINKSEIQLIQELTSKPLQRLAFTLLCVAKYHNQLFDKNNNWVNYQMYQIFKLAGVANRTQAERLCMLNELYKLNMIKYSKKNTNTNVCVNYILDDDEIAIELHNMQELGKEYSLYCGEKYIRCEKCGILFRSSSNNSKYYKNCGKYERINIKTIICCDCGKEFEVDSSSRSKRCNKCSHIAILNKNKRYNDKRRIKK